MAGRHVLDVGKTTPRLQITHHLTFFHVFCMINASIVFPCNRICVIMYFSQRCISHKTKVLTPASPSFAKSRLISSHNCKPSALSAAYRDFLRLLRYALEGACRQFLLAIIMPRSIQPYSESKMCKNSRS